MKKWLLCLALLLGGLPTLAHAALVDRIACVVDGQVITLSEVEERVRVLRSRVPDAKPQVLYREATDALVAEKLLKGQLEALHIEVRASELQMAIDDVIRQNGLSSEDALRAAVERQGMSWEEYRETLQTQLAQMKLINLKVRSQIQVSEDEVKRRYAELMAAEKGEQEVRASHLLILVTANASPAEVEQARQEAARLSRTAREGADFQALLADAEGQAKRSGGDLGWFRRGEMVRELEEAAFRLEAGTISDPIRTRFGWHVLKVEEKRDVPTRTLEAMSASIRDQIYQDELERYTQRYVEELKKDAVLEYPMPELTPESR